MQQRLRTHITRILSCLLGQHGGVTQHDDAPCTERAGTIGSEGWNTCGGMKDAILYKKPWSRMYSYMLPNMQHAEECRTKGIQMLFLHLRPCEVHHQSHESHHLLPGPGPGGGGALNPPGPNGVPRGGNNASSCRLRINSSSRSLNAVSRLIRSCSCC